MGILRFVWSGFLDTPVAVKNNPFINRKPQRILLPYREVDVVDMDLQPASLVAPWGGKETSPFDAFVPRPVLCRIRTRGFLDPGILRLCRSLCRFDVIDPANGSEEPIISNAVFVTYPQRMDELWYFDIEFYEYGIGECDE